MSKKNNAQQTRFEKSNGKETATYHEIIAFYKQLENSSDIVALKKMGSTDAGYPLHLMMVSSDMKHDPAKWHKEKKVVILINNGIHPGEPDGIDATMMLLRDIVRKKIKLPDNVALAVIPVYNIGGTLNRNSTTRVNQDGPAEYGFRGNSQNLDLNRDFTKNDSEEAKSFAEIFHFVEPDLFIDNHVSDGADFQHTMTLITTQYEKLGPLGAYLKNELEPKVYAGMKKKGWDMIPYIEDLDTEKGTIMFNESPRYSTGYAALFNTMGFMPETHMLKPYKDRVKSTYDLMVTFIEVAEKQSSRIIKERKAAQQSLLTQQAFPLNWKPDTSKHTLIEFKGYTQKTRTSKATGLEAMYYDKTSPFTTQMPFFNTFLPLNLINKPKAYIIPRGWHRVIERLKLNGVKMKPLKKDSVITVTAYTIDSYKSYPTPIESHHKNHSIKLTASQKEMKFLEGDMIIQMDQAANRYILEMLEPQADDSFFAWNFFDGILQRKEGYSDYRWEDIAAEVLEKDAGLRARLEQKKAQDPKFASNSSEILAFIYKSSPYYETAHMHYPVVRIEK